jgi:hypothetical protein
MGSDFEFQYGQEFSLPHIVQIGCGPTQPLVQWVLPSVYPGIR